MLAHQVVPREMCLAAGQMKKFIQKVTFVKSNKLLFQLLWLIGCDKYSIWNWFSLLLGAIKGKWCLAYWTKCLCDEIHTYIHIYIYFYLNIFESLPQELDCSSRGLNRSIILMWLLSFLPHCDYIFPSPSPRLGGEGGLMLCLFFYV